LLFFFFFFFFLISSFAIAQVDSASFADISSQASAAREANDIPHALELYRQAVKLNAKWSDGWWYLGRCITVAANTLRPAMR
jgi:hypothetical protein